MKIIFFGSSNYCLPILKTLQEKFSLSAVVTKPDKPVGRKQLLTPSPVSQFASSRNISSFTPNSKSELLSIKNNLSSLSPDIFIVADYGLIIPIEIINLPKYKTLNVHFSLLPLFRGATPVQHTILQGEKTAGISIFIMDESLDTGSIFWQKEVPLSGNETSNALYQKLFDISAGFLPEVITDYAKGKINQLKQDNSKATFTKRLTKDDGFIPFILLKQALTGTKPTSEQLHDWPLFNSLYPNESGKNEYILLLERAVRALSPWPGVWTFEKLKSEEKRLKILKGHIEVTSQKPSTGSGHHPDSTAAQSATYNLQLTTKFIPDLVQLEGKNPVSFKQFLTAYPDVFINEF